MTVDEAIAFLGTHQPMAATQDLSEEDMAAFVAAIDVADSTQDPRLLRPILRSFGPGDGNGIYCSAICILARFPTEDLVVALLDACVDAAPATSYWLLQVAMSCRDCRLSPFAINRLLHGDSGERIFAAYVIEGIYDPSLHHAVIVDVLVTEDVPEVRDALEQIIVGRGD